MIETCWSDFKFFLMCDIWINVLLQTSALVGPLHIAFSNFGNALKKNSSSGYVDELWAVNVGPTASIVCFQQCDPLLPWGQVFLTAFTFLISHLDFRTKHLPVTCVDWLTRSFETTLNLTKTTFIPHLTTKTNHTHCHRKCTLSTV
jgi:hypothetical protein